MTYLKLHFQDTFWVAPPHAGIIEFSKFLLQLKNQRAGSKTVSGFSVILILKGIMFRESKSLCFLLNKNVNFKNETESKMENLTHNFREMNLVIQLA